MKRPCISADNVNFKFIIGFFIISFYMMATFASAENREFIVGVENIEYYPHYDFTKENKGVAKRILDLFAQSKNYHFKYRPLPVKRLFSEFVSLELDFKYPDHPLWQKEIKKNVKVIYSKPVVNIVAGTMVLPENVGRGIDSFKTLGTVLGFTPFHWADLIESKKIIIHEDTDVGRLLLQALMGRIDGADVELSVANYHLRLLDKQGALLMDPNLPHLIASFHLSTVTHPDIIKELNLFLMQNSSKIAKMKRQFYIRESID
ncbi:hypothetical protein KJ966_06860 [bacterium]|nr:hypothetical protein [bacterium]